MTGDSKHYCGEYKGLSVWQYGQVIGSNWYGDFYITERRGKTQRQYKVKDSVHSSWEGLKKWINEVYLKDKEI